MMLPQLRRIASCLFFTLAILSAALWVRSWLWSEYILFSTSDGVILMPDWPWAVVLALLAIAIHPQPRFKFSLRDLLTLTTVAALVIGPLAFWLRSIS